MRYAPTIVLIPSEMSLEIKISFLDGSVIDRLFMSKV